MDLRIWAIVISASVLLFTTAEAQECYKCFGLSSNNPLMAQPASQFPIQSCLNINPQTSPTERCTGKCFTQNFTVNYNFRNPNNPMVGNTVNLDVDYFVLGCGSNPRNGCQDFANLPNIDVIRRQTEQVVRTTGGTVNTINGKACFCTGNRCNTATTNMKANASLLAICLLALVVVRK